MITIYGNPLSTPANKVRVCANALGIAYDYKEINLRAGEQSSPSFLAINPVGKVPALQDGSFSLFESDAIVRYLGARSSSALFPTDIGQRAHIDQWMCFASQHIGLAISKIIYNTHFYKVMNVEKDERSLSEGKEWLTKYLSVIEKHLTAHPYFAGNAITLADICAAVTLDPIDVLEVSMTGYPKTLALRDRIRQAEYYQKVHKSYGDTFETLMSGAR